nr:hypothetical protein [Clostridia bacterium]
MVNYDALPAKRLSIIALNAEIEAQCRAVPLSTFSAVSGLPEGYTRRF